MDEKSPPGRPESRARFARRVAVLTLDTVRPGDIPLFLFSRKNSFSSNGTIRK